MRRWWPLLVAAVVLVGGAAVDELVGGVLVASVVALLGLFVPDGVLRMRENAAAREGLERTSRALPDALIPGHENGPATLLRADREIVPFIGRTDELRRLRAWCEGPERVGVALVTGNAGVGKTRLALRLAATLPKGWNRRLVRGGGEAAVTDSVRAVTKEPTLLIVDYAESRAELSRLLEGAGAGPGRLRILLLARSIGEWWTRLAIRPADTLVIALAEDALPDTEDEELIKRAMPRFAEALGLPVPEVDIRPGTPGHHSLLVLHTAALVAVLAGAERPASSVRVSAEQGVLDELLRHEGAFWYASAEVAKLNGLDGTTIRRCVAVAGLFGSADEPDATDLLRLVPGLENDPLLRGNVARWLREHYPGDGTAWLGSLQPDLLAEHHICTELAGSPQIARAVLEAFATRDGHQALTVLTRAAQHHAAAPEILHAWLKAGLPDIAPAAIAVAIEAGRPLGQLLTRALQDADLGHQEWVAIEHEIPSPTSTLVVAGAHAAERGYETLPADSPPTVRADALRRLGLRFAELGRPEKALPLTRQSVDLFRRLAARNPGRFGAQLAGSLVDLGIWLSDLGRPEEGLAPAQEAVEIFRGLAASDPGGRTSGLASSLGHLGVRFSDLGRPEEALAHTQEAVALWRGLAATDPGRRTPPLAESLTNLGVRFAAMGRFDEALAAVQEAVDLWRVLAADDPDRHNPGLAGALTNLGVRLYEIDKPEEARPPTREAVALWRELASANPNRHNPSLANTLTHLGARHYACGHPAEGLAPAREAAGLWRELATAAPDRHTAGLAGCLTGLGALLSALRESQEAQAALREAVDLWRRLAADDPERHSPGLTVALTNLGAALLSEQVQSTEGRASTQEAAQILRVLAAANPGRYNPELARALERLQQPPLQD